MLAKLRKALERTAGHSKGDLTLCHVPKTQRGHRRSYRILCWVRCTSWHILCHQELICLSAFATVAW